MTRPIAGLFTPNRWKLRPGRRSNLAIDSTPPDQHLLKPAAGQAILLRISRGCHHSGAASAAGSEWRKRAGAMKTFTIATVILSLLTVPAYAQAKRPHTEEKKAPEKPKVDENAYKAALERIPEPKEKYDPWAVTKSAEPAKKPK
jgi:hypothetical protein